MMEINREKLERVLHAFHRMTGVRIAVIDATYGEIAGYPAESCALCRRLREKKEILDACVYSDRCAFIQACRSGRQYTYRCHMNMYESVYPVVLRGAVAGYVMIGQFIDEQEREAVYRSAREAVGDVPELRREVDALRALRSDEVASLAYLMAVCAEYLCFSEALTAGRSRKLAGVDAYIRENMKGPLSVSVLAQALGMSRTALYYLIKGESGRSVTDYVNFQRIERAKELLHENAGTEEILSETGMTGANYFGRLFRRYAGCTLRDYRKGVRSGER